MVEVKVLYHFLDKRACRNRMQGDVFMAPEEYAEELVRCGLVVYTKSSPKAEQVTRPADTLATPSAENTKAKTKKK